jgi:hypothetical protein
MTTEETIRLVFSFLGGGFVVGLMDWMRAARAERASRAAAYLSEQLRVLYGPLFYFCSENASICKVTGAIDIAYKKEYIDVQYAESARDSISKEAMQTIELNNRYVALMVENNNRMVEILNQNYGLIDPDDMEAFQEFRTHAMRYKIEMEIRPTFRIGSHLDQINFYNSDFADGLKWKFLLKTQQLSRLRHLSKSCFETVRDWWRREVAKLSTPAVDESPPIATDIKQSRE